MDHCRKGDLESARAALQAGVEVNSRMNNCGFSGLMISTPD